jgi:hypothetical protein
MLASLINSLKTVEDVREFNGKEYPLWAILTFSTLAITSSAKTYADIQRNTSRLQQANAGFSGFC